MSPFLIDFLYAPFFFLSYICLHCVFFHSRSHSLPIFSPFSIFCLFFHCSSPVSFIYFPLFNLFTPLLFCPDHGAGFCPDCWACSMKNPLCLIFVKGLHLGNYTGKNCFSLITPKKGRRRF